MSKTRDYLELIRIPGIFTAQADILAGFFIAGAEKSHILKLVLLLAASSCFYSAGMALNDFFDHRIDLKERPSRPIPSGRVTRAEAFGLGMLFFAAGISFAGMAGTSSLVVGLFLVCLILTYDGGVKAFSRLGPLNMGGCRYLNLLLGLSIIPFSSGDFFIPICTGVYISGITMLSRYEAEEANSSIPFPWILGSVFTTWLMYFGFYRLDILPDKAGLFLCSIWVVLVAGYILRLFFNAQASEIQKTVKMLLLGLIVLDSILVLGLRSVFPAVCVLLMLVPCLVISKKFYVT